MLSHRVKAHIFEHFQLIDNRLVARIGKHTVRPVPLIEYAVKKVGLAVERKPCHAFFVHRLPKRPHAEIGTQTIFLARDYDIVQFGVFGRPKLKIRLDFYFFYIFARKNFFIAVKDRNFLRLPTAIRTNPHGFFFCAWSDF